MTTSSRVAELWMRLRYSYWFVPALMAIGAVALALLMVKVDQVEEDGLVEQFGWVYEGGAEGAREVLSTIAGSMITVAGVVFSITIVALQLASSQFGPRVLRNFMRDRGNQVVLGTFIATFIYCLLVLRTIRGGDDSVVPSLSVTVGVALALASLGVLIFFIHHASVSIQAAHIVREVGLELYETIDRLFPEEIGRGEPERSDVGTDETAAAAGLGGEPIKAAATGYLQRTDDEALIRIAKEDNLVLLLPERPGAFFSPSDVLAVAWPAQNVRDSLAERVRGAMTLGADRTHEQDLLFAVDQLVEVAARSLSPSINDPFTAATCVDWLAAALVRRGGRSTPSPLRYDAGGTLRVIARPVGFEEMASACFDRIREYGHGHSMIAARLFNAFERVGRHVRNEEQRDMLREQARLTIAAASASLPEDEVKRLRAAYAKLEAVLG